MSADGLTAEALGRTVTSHLDAAAGTANVTVSRGFSARIISRGTRVVYLLQVNCPSGSRRIVVKQRRASNSRRAVGDACSRAEETVREYNAMQAAYYGLSCHVGENAAYLVPRPLAAIPAHGLLCMDVCPGTPLRTVLRHAVLLPWKRKGLERTLERCGVWLRKFTSVSVASAADPIAGEQCGSQTRSRRPYIYALLGLRGAALVQTLVEGARTALERFQCDRALARGIVDALQHRCRESRIHEAPLVSVHGKYTAQDIFVTSASIGVVDFEYSGCGTALNDLAFLVYELFMVNRWNVLSGHRVAGMWREALLRGFGDVNRIGLNCFVAYFMVHSLKPGGGLSGMTARRYASRWLTRWVRDPEI